MLFRSGNGVAILVHGEAEADVLPESPHVTLADAVVDKLGNLVQGSPGDAVLGDIHFPGLDGLPDFFGEVELNTPPLDRGRRQPRVGLTPGWRPDLIRSPCKNNRWRKW